jgi:hypothetical protein
MFVYLYNKEKSHLMVDAGIVVIIIIIHLTLFL